MRTLSLLFFTFRLLTASVLIYNFTRFIPSERARHFRQKNTLRAARKIAAYFLKQGGIYIKAAQYLSSVSNLFDTEFTEIFANVTSEVEIQPYENIRYRFLQEFGVEPEELYLEFDRKALTAASLGQVHVARIKDGRKVAVKFLHPNMEYSVRQDMLALKYATRLILWFYPYLDFRGHYKEFASMTISEIDYENEAENIRRARENFKDDERVIVPEVIDEFSRSTVLTTEFVQGIRIDDLEALDQAGLDRKSVAELLLQSYAKMLFDHRFYHADPHPGNVFVITEGRQTPFRLGFIDFGASQNFSERTFNDFQKFMDVLRMRDIPGLIDTFAEIGMLRARADRETYTNLAEIIYARYGAFKLEDYYRINPVRLGRIVKMRDLSTLDLRLRDLIADTRIPRKYIYLSRSISLLFSLAMRLDDEVNFFMVARPHLEAYFQPRPKRLLKYLRNRNWTQVLDNAMSGKNPSLRNILQEFPGNARKSNNDIQPRFLRHLFNQGLLGFVGVAGVFLWAYLYLGGETEYAWRILYGAGGIGAFLIYNMFFRRF